VAKDLKADGVKLDVVIANAGILSKEGMVDFAKVDIGVFDQHWQINVGRGLVC
jgi:NAD(P)-dependent dehydrogenase (short-subunit alcohol dehydrogenase family)